MGYSTYPTIKHETAATRAARGEPPDETPAEEALRSLACWLGAGGYNAPTVDAKVFEEKIRWGVENAIKRAVSLQCSADAPDVSPGADERSER